MTLDFSESKLLTQKIDLGTELWWELCFMTEPWLWRICASSIMEPPFRNRVSDQSFTKLMSDLVQVMICYQLNSVLFKKSSDRCCRCWQPGVKDFNLNPWTNVFEPWVEEVSAGACGEFLTENYCDFFDINVKCAGLSLGRGNGRCSGYIIFVIFAPQTKMLGYFLLLTKMC